MACRESSQAAQLHRGACLEEVLCAACNFCCTICEGASFYLAVDTCLRQPISSRVLVSAAEYVEVSSSDRNPSVFVSSGTLIHMPFLSTSCVHSFLSLVMGAHRMAVAHDAAVSCAQQGLMVEGWVSVAHDMA